MTISFIGSSHCNNSGVLDFEINSSGHLIVTYSDNTKEDLGLVVGADGVNFYPSEVGFEIPDEQFRPEQPIGWSYLSLANDTSILYFKTSDIDVLPSTWNAVTFGKGETGADGKSFQIDSSGTEFPTDGLYDGYTFLNSDTGEIYYYDSEQIVWTGPYQWQGEQGERGIFKIDSSGTEFPEIDTLEIGYTFYKTDIGYLYFVELNIFNQKVWSEGVQFKGENGDIGETGPQGIQGQAGKDISIIYNEIDTSYTNAVLVVGECPVGYVVSEIQIHIEQAFELPVDEMFVRFGGTTQSDTDGIIIADVNCFDINLQEQYIVNDINHSPSSSTEIISCVFNESVNNSFYGLMKVFITLSPVLPVYPIHSQI